MTSSIDRPLPDPHAGANRGEIGRQTSEPLQTALVELVLSACEESEDETEIADWVEARIASVRRTPLALEGGGGAV